MNHRRWPRRSGAVLLPLITIAAVGSASGGYFATSFGWTALAFAWGVVVVLVVTAPRLGAFDRVWLIASAALCIYMFASAAWAGSVDSAIEGGERALVYLAGVAAALLLLRRGDFSRWLGGIVLGVAGVCIYSLATRLYPTHFGGFNTADYRLTVPVGYWNALGIFAGIALLLGFGVAASGRISSLRFASSVALVVLAPTMYFTFSRGALFAIAVGAGAMFLLSSYRLNLVGAALVLGPAPAAGTVLAAHSTALTHRFGTLAAASHDGRRLALELALLAVLQAALALVYIFASTRLRVSRGLRLAFGAVIAAAIAVVLAGVIVEYGSPPNIARKAYDSFVSGPTGGVNLNGRLLSLSNDGRLEFWHSAWREFLAHPVVGSGEGGFARWWLAHRTSATFVIDTHNLYLQTLGELGVVGMALLVFFLGVPLVAALRARRHPLVAPAFGAYVAYLVHASVDWDWQVPAVTLLALFAGAMIVAAARPTEPRPAPMGQPVRIGFGIGAVAVAIVAFGSLIGNIALTRGDSAVLRGQGREAAVEGAKAHRWAPWSGQALKDLGEGRLLLGQKRSGLVALREAAAKDPGDWEIWFDIAAATTGAEQHTALARAKALNPESPEIADVEHAAGGTTN